MVTKRQSALSVCSSLDRKPGRGRVAGYVRWVNAECCFLELSGVKTYRHEFPPVAHRRHRGEHRLFSAYALPSGGGQAQSRTTRPGSHCGLLVLPGIPGGYQNFHEVGQALAGTAPLSPGAPCRPRLVTGETAERARDPPETSRSKSVTAS